MALSGRKSDEMSWRTLILWSGIDSPSAIMWGRGTVMIEWSVIPYLTSCESVSGVGGKLLVSFCKFPRLCFWSSVSRTFQNLSVLLLCDSWNLTDICNFAQVPWCWFEHYNWALSGCSILHHHLILYQRRRFTGGLARHFTTSGVVDASCWSYGCFWRLGVYKYPKNRTVVKIDYPEVTRKFGHVWRLPFCRADKWRIKQILWIGQPRSTWKLLLATLWYR